MANEGGGYTVHPDPAPLSTIDLAKRRVRDGGSIQNLKLFSRAKAMSGAPSIMDTSEVSKSSNQDWYNHEKNYDKCMSCHSCIQYLFVTNQKTWMAQFCSDKHS